MQLNLNIDRPDETGALDTLRRELTVIRETVTAIFENLPVQRKVLSEATRDLHIRVTWQRRNGFCPCCSKKPVCTAETRLDGSEYDHWYARHRNRPDETWLVCGGPEGCNAKLEDVRFKTSARSSFEAYQRAVKLFLEDGQPDLFADGIPFG